MDAAEKRTLFYSTLSELYRLDCIHALLGWDQQVYMPPAAGEARAAQLEFISVLSHQKMTSPEFGRAVDDLFAQLDQLSEDDQVNVREIKRILDIERKLPDDFVAEVATTSAQGYNTWVRARPANDFEAVRPILEKLVDLSRRRCDLVGYEDHPYDALLDMFEPGSRLSLVKPLLLSLAEQLREIIPPITELFRSLPKLEGPFDVSVQHRMGQRVAKDLGFSFESGRMDTTAHPFMTTLGPADVRIATRYSESDLLSGLYSTIHETGHALYDIGLPREWAGTPLGSSVSLSVHESQSRMWENLVGRSREFAVYLCGVVGEFFPGAAADPETLWRNSNRVQPSLIRTEADEVTYSQHVVIRMLLEERLVTGDLTVADLPAAWNELYEHYLGLRPTDYRNGVMQDVHWHSGAIGYFPTYALGNLYNAMMMESARQAIPDLPLQIERGEFGMLLGWLRDKVHRHGMRYRGPELIRIITGSDLSPQPFVDYLRRKFL